MKKKASTRERYGLSWDSAIDDLQIEFYFIQQNGYVIRDGKKYGLGLVGHYLAARKLLWPERYEHRWTRLLYEQVFENQIVIASGSASCQKTSHFSEIVLIAYWAFPQTTAVLVSTTTVDKLDSAVFGEIKMLFQKGRSIYSWLAGNVVDHKHAIFTDNIKDDEIRDARKGIIGKACYQGTKWVGLGTYAGIKQERFWFLCDELQYMEPTFLACIPNMRSNTGGGGLHVLGSGNPNHDPESQLAIVAEPLGGWTSVEENTKTSVWPIKLSGGVCVNLIGPDSPNFDPWDGEGDRYPRLIGKEFERTIAHDYGRNSPTYETQVMGRMKLALAHSRVITRQLCKDHKAHDGAQWEGTNRTRIYAVDPAYGGGDRCVAGWGEFGPDLHGRMILKLNPPRLIRIDLKKGGSPEEQIAEEVFKETRELGISPDRVFYDSFGKGTVGFAFARKFGFNCPVPVDASAKPTARPVRADLYVLDEKTGERRLKRCDEHYSKFITEMWFSVRYAIESEQIREMPEDVMLEGTWREYYDVAGGKIEVEPKADMKERSGKSPDLMDWCSILVEGARRHGFTISRLGVTSESKTEDEEVESEWEDLIKSKMLIHA